MYASFGVASPFWPLFFTTRGITPEELGVLLGLGTLARLLANPVVGRLADIAGTLRGILAGSAALAALAAVGLVSSDGYALLLMISVCQAAALAPITTLADALALNAATKGEAGQRFEYGWVRGAGSAAFVAGTLVAGYVLTHQLVGLSAVVWMHVALLSGVASAALMVPGISSGAHARSQAVDAEFAISGLREVLQNSAFCRVIAIAALVFGSHAMHDAFAVIRWTSAGLTAMTASLLWSEAVIAEVIVFFLLGPMLIKRFGAAGAALMAAAAALVRWIVMSQTTEVAILALVQPLHGLTFALLHLACMRVIGISVPARLAATAQGLYAFGPAVASALLTALSGIIYGAAGGSAFLIPPDGAACRARDPHRPVDAAHSRGRLLMPGQAERKARAA
jgi:PPP family 3-phenylpropionic acid transporter